MITHAFAHLHCHPATPCSETRALQVRVLRTSRELEFTFLLLGNTSGIRLEPSQTPKALAELWRNTCFEAFVTIDGQQAYHELNFAPSGEWRVYAFRAYRVPAPLEPSIRSPCIVTRATAERFELNARLCLADLSRFHSHSVLCLGLSAVVETKDGSRSFWALRHSTGRPDFHQAAAFALRLKALRRDPGT